MARLPDTTSSIISVCSCQPADVISLVQLLWSVRVYSQIQATGSNTLAFLISNETWLLCWLIRTLCCKFVWGKEIVKKIGEKVLCLPNLDRWKGYHLLVRMVLSWRTPQLTLSGWWQLVKNRCFVSVSLVELNIKLISEFKSIKPTGSLEMLEYQNLVQCYNPDRQFHIYFRWLKTSIRGEVIMREMDWS